MSQNEFCIIANDVTCSYSPSYTQFLRHSKQDEARSRAFSAQKNLEASKDPIIKGQICNELHKLAKAKVLEEERIKSLHQCEELQEFNTLIKRAFVRREYFDQRDLKNRKLKEELQARLEENKRYEEKFKRYKEMTIEEERERIRKKTILRQHLLQQIQEREQQRRLEREFVKKESESRPRHFGTTRIQRDIKNEDQSLLKFTQEKDKHLQNVKLYRNQRKVTDAKEDLRMYWDTKSHSDEMNRLCVEKRNQIIQKRAALSERIGQEVFALEMEKQKRKDLILELYVEERLAKDEESFKRNLQKEVQRTETLKKEFHRSLLRRQHETFLQRQEKNVVIKEQLKTVDNLKEMQLLKTKQYRQDLLNSIEVKRLGREIEALQNKKEYEEQLAFQKKKRQEIESEKLRLLKTLPLAVLQCLPAGALSDEHRSILDLTCKETKQNI